MGWFGAHEQLGVQVMLFTEKGRVLFDIPQVADFRLDIDHDRGWINSVDTLAFSMRPYSDINGVQYVVYDEEAMKQDFNARVRTERAEVQQAVRALERGGHG